MKIVTLVWRGVRLVLGGLLGIVMAVGGIGWFFIFFLLILGSCNDAESMVIQCPAALAWTLVCVIIEAILGVIAVAILPKDFVAES